MVPRDQLLGNRRRDGWAALIIGDVEVESVADRIEDNAALAVDPVLAIEVTPLAICPVRDWLPVKESTTPIETTLPVGGRTAVGLEEQAAVSKLIAIRAVSASQDLPTSRDYLPGKESSRADWLTSLLIADRAPGWAPTKLCDWLRWRVSQVVRQRSAKPPPRVRIPHSPPFCEYDLTPASPFTSRLTATVTATSMNSGAL